MCARDQGSIFSTGGKFHSDYGLLLELHTLTLVACSYALLNVAMVWQSVLSSVKSILSQLPGTGDCHCSTLIKNLFEVRFMKFYTK